MAPSPTSSAHTPPIEQLEFQYDEKPENFGLIIEPATIDQRGAVIKKLVSGVARSDMYTAVEPGHYFIAKLNSLDITLIQFGQVSVSSIIVMFSP